MPGALLTLASDLQVQSVHWTAEYPLNERRRDRAVAAALAEAGVTVHEAHDDVVVQPGTVLTQAGQPFTVFSPFFKQWRGRVLNSNLRRATPPPQAAPPCAGDAVPTHVDGAREDVLAELWPAGEAAAQQRLQVFLGERIGGYGTARDLPAQHGTSRISPDLAVGTLAPKYCFRLAMETVAGDAASAEGAERWIAELAWRDFYRHIVAAFDHVSFGQPFKRQTATLPWRHAPDELAAWKAGRTGYPFVDAGMRQLNAEGWMHNRLRMVTAMFLTKHLLIDWREGERYFMQQLVDGDFASNNGGWQWSASTGTDAAPYFRIFNPVTQGERFDADEAFMDRYVPERKQDLFSADGSGEGYPAPIVEHRFARERALDFFKAG